MTDTNDAEMAGTAPYPPLDLRAGLERLDRLWAEYLLSRESDRALKWAAAERCVAWSEWAVTILNVVAVTLLFDIGVLGGWLAAARGDGCAAEVSLVAMSAVLVLLAILSRR